MSWRRWPWLEEGVLPLSVVLLRLCWLWPWLLIIGRWTLPPEMRPYLPLWLVAALMLGGALTARLLPAGWERPRRARVAAAGLGLAAVLFTLWWRLERTEHALWDVRWIADEAVTLTHWNGTVPLSVAVFGLSVYLWLRGMQDSISPNHDDIWRAFASGFVALVLLLVAGRIDPAGLPPSTQRWIVLYFAVGMTALALAGLRMARSNRNASAPLPANRYWIASIATLVAALLTGGMILALLITPSGVMRTLGWVRHIAGWLAIGLGYVLYAAAYLMFLVLTPLLYWLQEHVGFWLRFDTDRLQEIQQGILDAAEQPSPVTLPPLVDESLRWIVLLGVLALVTLAFAAALHLIRRQDNESEEEVRENVLSQELLRDQATSLWQRWRDRLHGRTAEKHSPFLSLQDVGDTRRRIRAVYQAFLAAMLAHGHPRAPGQTPTAFGRVAGALLGADADDAQQLTDRYIVARYGDAEPAEEDADAAEAAWAAIDECVAQLEQDRPAR